EMASVVVLGSFQTPPPTPALISSVSVPIEGYMEQIKFGEAFLLDGPSSV
ncbi:hypothetical protein KI387_024063, partial [Taxus chinensis]